MRTHFPVLAPIAVGILRIWRKLAVGVALCAIAVFFGWLATWLAIRLSVTYLPPADDQAVTGETVERPVGDLPRLQERVRRIAEAVLPAVVAVRNPSDKSSEAGGYQECMMAGGDSGGPYFSLDGQLVGIPYCSNGYPMTMYINDASFYQRNGALNLFNVTGCKLIASLFDAMRRGEISPYDGKESVRINRELEKSTRLQPADFSQGSASLAPYRSVVEPAHASVVVVLNAGVAVGLGTIVGAQGWVITKASELPGQPMCRLPGGKVVSARVGGVDPAFDLALLLVSTMDLTPVRWANDFNPPVGTLLAAVGTEQPLAVGVVSVPRRDLGAPIRPANALPLRLPASGPGIVGGQQPIDGYSLRAAVGLPRATAYHVADVFGLAFSAGIRRHDLVYNINGRRILTEADVLKAVSLRWSGDVVPVRLERAGRMMDLLLPLGPETSDGESNYWADDFPTVIECAVPFYCYECGGPIVDLTGRAIGITIARQGAHGGMVIPGDCVLKLLPELHSGRLAGNWAPVRPPGK